MSLSTARLCSRVIGLIPRLGVLAVLAAALSVVVAQTGAGASLTGAAAGTLVPSALIVQHGHSHPAAPTVVRHAPAHGAGHDLIDLPELRKLAENPHTTIGNTACGTATVNPSTTVYGGEGLTLSMNWTATTSTSGCQMFNNNCPTAFGDCNAGYWVVGVFCSTLAAVNLASAQDDCDLNDIIVLTDDSSGPDNSGNTGTSYNTCNTVNTIGDIFGGLPGTLNCIADGGTGDGWTDHWSTGSTTGSASGVFDETGSGTPFSPASSGVDCPPSAANIAAGAIANTCALVMFPVTFSYVCVFDVCIPNIGDSGDGVSEETSDYLAALFQYEYAPSFTNGNSVSVQAGSPLNFNISTNASPAATVTESGTLPSGVSLQQEGGGTAALSGTPSASSAGTYVITLNATNGVSPNASQQFTLTVTPKPPPPTITSVSPPSGPTAGGTTVTITGSNFTGTTGVTFGTAAASKVNVVSSTEVTCVSPSGSGAVTVDLTTPYGTAGSPSQFTYVPPPSIATNGLAPTEGPTAGGTSVTITGTNLSGTSAVTFGAGAATHVTVVSSTEVTAVSPAGTGSVNVSVTTVGGTASSPTEFTYVPPPSIAPTNGLDPDVGPVGGGTPVTITGTNLAGTTSVTFGPNPATGVTVISPTGLSVVSPAGTGAVTVSLTTAGGTAVSATPFTYYQAPSGLAITPDFGSTGGGTTVTITGIGLSGVSEVDFGSTPAAAVTPVSSTEITAVSPAGSGSVAISVSTPGGTAVASPQFTYLNGPSISGVAPAQGPQGGGTAVTISGSGLSAATGVEFGAATATFTDVTDSSLVAFAPAGTGTVDIVVTTPGGTATSPVQYSYLAGASITAISPASGPASGGAAVTVTGTGLLGTTSVYFGSQPATGLTDVTDTSMTVTAPPGSGTVDVTITTDAGVAVSPTQYTYIEAPTLTSIAPASGPTSGGTTVLVTGTALSEVTSVEFGSVAATFGDVTGGSIVATAPPGTGNVDITVTTAGGTATSPVPFSYFVLPAITSISPGNGAGAGGTTVTINGSALDGAIGVQFGTSAGKILSASASSVSALTPPGAGIVDLSVTTASGTAVSPEQFVYVARPVVTSLSPTSGPKAGGISVTVTGTNLASASAVHFGTVKADITSVTDTSITAIEPPGGGTVNVTVTTPGGTSATSTKDHFGHAAAPTVTAMTPTSGAPGGGSAVEIVGTDLCGASTVRFGDGVGKVTSVNPACTLVTVRTPAWTGTSPASPHPVPVVLQASGGSSTAPIMFTYIDPGYWMVGRNGAVYGFGGAAFYGSMGTHHLNKPIVAMAGTPDHEGYWLFASDGGVFAFGDARFYGSVPQALGPHRSLNAPIVAVEATPDGRGYRMFAADGGVFDFGDAKYVGSLPGLHVAPNKPIVAATSDPIGEGYWLVGADGGVYTFPDAVYKGSLGGDHLSTSIVWMANTVTGGGYWIFGSDGEVWALGDARTYAGPRQLSAPIVTGVATTTDGGYWLLARNGAVYDYGDAPTLGSLPGSHVSVDDIVGGIGF